MQSNRINIMEVCGTHTMSIARHGLKKLFPTEVSMLSGPGCPICVTPVEDIDKAIDMAKKRNVIITTFGDMFHVPGSVSNLSKEHAKGADIRIVYSASDALEIAVNAPAKEVVFLGVGFETTSPTIAATVITAKRKRISNFSVIPMFKTIPEALKAILDIKERRIDGFILPGHVSTIIGSIPYKFIEAEYKVPGVIAGFEPDDILQSVNILLDQIKNKQPRVTIQYTRSVLPEGNRTAQKILSEVFIVCDSKWRSIGNIPRSGLTFNKKYMKFNALQRFRLKTVRAKEPKGCLCGKILLGLAMPKQCALFGKACTPSDPIGPCMVSSEGTCAAVYKYELWGQNT